jgi:hypothetical protein
VKVTAVHARTRGSASYGKGSTGCEVVLVTEGVTEIAPPVDDQDQAVEFDHVVDGIPRRVTRHYDRDTQQTTVEPTDEPATFAAIDFLMEWERYAKNRNEWLERKRERADTRAATEAENARLYAIAERALGHVPITCHQGTRTEWVDNGRRQIARIPTVEIDLADAEKLAAFMEEQLLAGDRS